MGNGFVAYTINQLKPIMALDLSLPPKQFVYNYTIKITIAAAITVGLATAFFIASCTSALR